MIISASTPPAATADHLSNATHSDNVLESSTSIGGAHSIRWSDSISYKQPPVVKLEQTIQDAAVKAQGLDSPKELSTCMREAPTSSETRSDNGMKRQKKKMRDSDFCTRTWNYSYNCIPGGSSGARELIKCGEAAAFEEDADEDDVPVDAAAIKEVAMALEAAAGEAMAIKDIDFFK